MIGRHRPGQARLAKKCREPGIALVARGDQALDDIGPVQALERHDIADRRQRHDVQPLQQVDLWNSLVARLAKQALSAATSTRKTDTRSAATPLPRKIVLAVRIHQSMAVRQIMCHLVVIDDDDVDIPLFGSPQSFVAGRATVDRHDQLRAVVDQLIDRRRVGSVAFEDAIGNIDTGLHAEMREETVHQRRGSRAIDVIVAEDRNVLAAPDCLDQASGRLLAIRQRVGIEALDCGSSDREIPGPRRPRRRAPASTRAIKSGRPCTWDMASARFCPA